MLYKFALVAATASAISLNKYDKPINSERAEPWETQTHDIVYYRPNKYFAQRNSSSLRAGETDYGVAAGVDEHAITMGKVDKRE